MNLKELQQSWNTLAAKDAMWAVLTGPYGSKRAWDPEVFFRTGKDEIDLVVSRVKALGGSIGERALDFGCGVGRLTQALGTHFNQVDGVDISAVMIEQAGAFNRLGDRCRYHLNETDNLGMFADRSFDFVYSNIVLQHMEPQYSRRYIREFFRLLRPGGIACFQIPSEPVEVSYPRTRSSAPLPAAACVAEIEAPAKLRCAPGAPLTLRIMVRNNGTELWPWMSNEPEGGYCVRLGNHWRHRFGWMLKRDDARTELAHDLPPGERMEIAIRPTVPAKPGTYTLEFDMVQELVRWWADVGSKPARTRVEVDAALPPGTVEGVPAVIEMHGIPRSQVEAIIQEAGAVLLAADEDDAPGAGWTSFRDRVKAL